MKEKNKENKIVLDETTKLRIRDDFVIREIGGEIVIIPTNDSSMIGNGMLSPNETAAFIWKQFTEPRTIPEVVKNCMEEYEASEEVITNAVVGFAQQSLALNIMERV